MINREFTPFGFDIRYICVFLSIILLIVYFFKRKKTKIKIDHHFKLISFFFLLSLSSNVMWFYNDFSLNTESFKIIIISYVYNILSFITFYFYQNSINYKKYLRYLNLSLIILILSMIYIIEIGDLNSAFLSTYSGKAMELSSNFFGGKYRYAGFAQDPNYSSLFLVIGILSNLYFCRKKIKLHTLIYIILYCIFYCLSASKTILVAVIFTLLYYWITKMVKNKISGLLVLLMITYPIMIIFLNIPIFNNNISMLQRLRFWTYAKDLFLQSPLIGNGLTSFRSYFLENATLGWYVQCHSTIFQILSENGLIGLLLFYKIIYDNVKKNKNSLVVFLNFIFIIFMINTETLYHIYSIFIIGIIPIIMKGVNDDEEKSNCISN